MCCVFSLPHDQPFYRRKDPYFFSLLLLSHEEVREILHNNENMLKRIDRQPASSYGPRILQYNKARTLRYIWYSQQNSGDSGDCTTVATQPRQLHYSNNLSKILVFLLPPFFKIQTDKKNAQLFSSPPSLPLSHHPSSQKKTPTPFLHLHKTHNSASLI